MKHPFPNREDLTRARERVTQLEGRLRGYEHQSETSFRVQKELDEARAELGRIDFFTTDRKGTTMKDELPQTGEGPNGENLAPGLKYRPEDLPVHQSMLAGGDQELQERTTEYMNAQLPETVDHQALREWVNK
jgi:hypothetical protein